MEFTVRFRPTTQRVLAEYVLSMIDRLREENMSNACLAQEVYLLKHKQELSSLIEAKIVPKILQDIDRIMEEGCAIEISEMDFNHVHLCSLSPIPIFNLSILLLEENIGLLYHTCEKWSFMPYFAKRNVRSTLLTRAEVIPIPYEKLSSNYGESYRFSKITVYSSELGWYEWGKIKFEQDVNGSHQSGSGLKLKMTGLLSDRILSYTKVDNENIKVDGQTIAQHARDGLNASRGKIS